MRLARCILSVCVKYPRAYSRGFCGQVSLDLLSDGSSSPVLEGFVVLTPTHWSWVPDYNFKIMTRGALHVPQVAPLSTSACFSSARLWLWVTVTKVLS